MPHRDTVPDFHAILGGPAPVGTWVSIADAAVAEIVAGSGADFVLIDGEHGPVDVTLLGPILAAIRPHGVPTLFRVAENEQARIQHALDAGASGVIVPRIRSAADAARAIAATRYPPAGTRGIAPRRAADYGRDTGYLGRANDVVACVIQVETAEALAELDAILALPRLDAILVGPSDLAGSLGHPGDNGHADVQAAIADVLARARAAGVPAGIHVPNAAEARQRIAEGFGWVSAATDTGLLSTAVDTLIREMRGG
jgi:4-hydroxy-2-oxoheptanedioate aldolase